MGWAKRYPSVLTWRRSGSRSWCAAFPVGANSFAKVSAADPGSPKVRPAVCSANEFAPTRLSFQLCGQRSGVGAVAQAGDPAPADFEAVFGAQVGRVQAPLQPQAVQQGGEADGRQARLGDGEALLARQVGQQDF